MKRFISFFLIFSFLVSNAQDQRLIVAEYRVDSPKIGNYTYLTCYHFNNGRFDYKDTLFEAPTNQRGIAGSYVRFDLGENQIYQNRYLISGIGNVIDLKRKKLLLAESDEFIEARKDLLIFHRDNIFTGTGYLTLNLKTGKYGFINHDHQRPEGNYAPDGKQRIYVDRSELPYKLVLFDSDRNKRMLVKNAGNGPEISGNIQFPTIETFWLNADEFLYGVHQHHYQKNKISKASVVADTAQHINGEEEKHFELERLQGYSKIFIRKYSVKTGNDIIFHVLDSVPFGSLNGRFYRDGIGQLVYRTPSFQHYLVDTINNKLEVYTYYQCGYDFAVSILMRTDTGSVLTFKEKEIGCIWSDNVRVANGALALEYATPGSNLAYPRGFQVWFSATQQWQVFNLPWICTIIGWMEQP